MEQRNAELKTKSDVMKKEGKELRKKKLADYITRGQKWFEQDEKAKKELVELKRQVLSHHIRTLHRLSVQEITMFQLKLKLPSSLELRGKRDLLKRG